MCPTRPPRTKPDAFGKAVSLLARREQSQRELKGKLARSGYERQEVDGALREVAERGYQDDARFAAVLARSRAAAGYGPRRIAAELASHGLKPADIAVVIADLGDDWSANARRQLERHYGRKPPADAVERSRRAGFLLRRGFDVATVSALTRADCGDPDDSFD